MYVIYIGMPWNTHWHTGVAASLRNLPLLQALTALDTPKGSPPKSPYYSEATQYYSEATRIPPGCHWDAGMPLGCVQVAAFKTGHSNINRACTCADLRAIPSNPLQDLSQASLITKSIKNRLWWTPVRGAQHEDHFLT